MTITKLQSSRDFFRIWFFWKKQAVFIFFLIIGMVMLYAYTATPVFESNAEILVLPRTDEAKIISTGVDDQRTQPVTTEDIFTEMELISNNSVLKKTVESFGSDGINLATSKKNFLKQTIAPFKSIYIGTLQILKLTSPPTSDISKQIVSLKNSITVESAIDSNIILISLQAERQEKIKTVLTSLLNTYLKHRDEVFTQKEGLQFYSDQTSNYKEKLDVAESKLKEFQKNGNIVNLQIQNQANIDLLTKLNNDLQLLEIKYEENDSKIAALKKVIRDDPSIVHLTKEMRTIPAIFELEKGIVPILIQRTEISKTFVETSREFQSINRQIKMLRNEIRYEVKKAIKTDELELGGMKIKINALKKRIDFLKTEANEFNQKEKIHQELARQVKLYTDSYLLYTSKTENSKINSQKRDRNLANVTISSEPTIPEKPVSPNRLMLLILSILVGLFAALFTPFILESIDTKIKTIDDVEELLELPVICSFSNVNKT